MHSNVRRIGCALRWRRRGWRSSCLRPHGRSPAPRRPPRPSGMVASLLVKWPPPLRWRGACVSQLTPTSRFPVMKAVVLTRTGGPDVLQVQDWPDPSVGAGEVRIAVRAAGVNFADTMARVGLYPATPKRPCVLGYEVAGEVETIGPDVSGLVVGQRVMAGTQFGGQAEVATAQARDVMPMPDHLSFEEGAGV